MIHQAFSDACPNTALFDGFKNRVGVPNSSHVENAGGARRQQFVDAQ